MLYWLLFYTHLAEHINDGVTIIEPVALYSKPYIKKLEEIVISLDKGSADYMDKSFKTVEEAIKYLEESNEINES